MAGKMFEKKKLNENDYKGDEKKVKGGKVIAGILTTVVGAVIAIVKVVSGHGSSSSKA